MNLFELHELFDNCCSGHKVFWSTAKKFYLKNPDSFLRNEPFDFNLRKLKTITKNYILYNRSVNIFNKISPFDFMDESYCFFCCFDTLANSYCRDSEYKPVCRFCPSILFSRASINGQGIGCCNLFDSPYRKLQKALNCYDIEEEIPDLFDAIIDLETGFPDELKDVNTEGANSL